VQRRRIFTRLGKRVFDIAGAATGLCITAPAILGAAVAVRLVLGKPVFFRQVRPGRLGRPFELVKLRTMRAPRECEDAISTDAQRLTSLGSILRAMSVDELPTLLNVLRGDMSLVGPRPLLMEYLPRYSLEQARRHEVFPGVTGWAQVNGRNALSWEQKLELDVWYVDNWSLGLDMSILARTLLKVIQRDGISHQGEATMAPFMGSETNRGVQVGGSG